MHSRNRKKYARHKIQLIGSCKKNSEGCNVAYLKLKSSALKRMSCYGYSFNLEKDMNDKLRL
jgi:hypothetical protein